MSRHLRFALFFLVACYFPQQIFAQKFTLQATLRDSAERKPLEFATIFLFREMPPPADSTGAAAPPAMPAKPLRSAFSDSDGAFRFAALDSGLYRIEASLVGHQNLGLGAISVVNDTDLGVLTLKPTDNTLQQVTVTAAKPVLEVKADRIVFNVENDPTASGGTAIETLQKIPFVTVDQDDNIRLKGKTNFKVQLNGRNTGLFAKNPKDALRSFPANLIKRIEIITSPGARYDAEGTAGIINIVTAGKVAGVNGSLSTGLNTLGQYNESASLSAKYGDWGFSSYFGGGGSDNERSSFFSRTNFYPTDLYRETRDGSGNGINHYFYGNAELAYDLDSLNTLSFYVNFHNGRYAGHDESRYLAINAEQTPIEQGSYLLDNESRWPNNTYGLDYVKKFKRPEQEFSASLALNQDRGENNVQNTRLFDFGGTNTDNRFVSNQPEDEYTAELNYAQPLRKDHTLSFGAKTILRRIDNDYRQENRDSLSGELVLVPDQTGVFHYRQDVWSGYGEYAWTRKKWSFRPGVRYEYTQITGDVSGQNAFANEYPALIPTLNISYKMSETQSWRFGYTRRIQRPGLWYLKPQLNNGDPRNTSIGNPYLSPEFTHSLELSLNLFKNGRNLSFTLEQGVTTDAINEWTQIDSATGVANSTYGNFGRNYRSALTAYGSGAIGKKINFYANFTLAYEILEGYAGAIFYRNDGVTGNLYGNLQYNFGNGWRIQGNGWWGIGYLSLQSRSNGWYNYQLGLTKSLLKNKTLRIGVLADQFLLKNRIWENTLTDPRFETHYETAQPARALRFSVSWRFGKLHENVSRKRGVSNSDQKSGGSGGGGN